MRKETSSDLLARFSSIRLDVASLEDATREIFKRQNATIRRLRKKNRSLREVK